MTSLKVKEIQAHTMLKNRMEFVAFLQSTLFKGDSSQAGPILRAEEIEQHIRNYMADSYGEMSADPKSFQGATMSIKSLKKWLCEQFFDVRAFGAELETYVGNVSIAGPVRFDTTVACSCAAPIDGVFPRATFMVTGHVSPYLAEKTGFSTDDLEMLLESMVNMYELNPGTEEGILSLAGPLVLFKHVGDPEETEEIQQEQAMCGQAPAHKLFGLISLEKKVEHPQDWYDYKVSLSKAPNGVDVGLYRFGDTEVSWGHAKSEIEVF